MVKMVISGGQAGVDRAALDAAMELGIPVGGYCTRERNAEDGRIPDKYPLMAIPSSDYPERTIKNIEAADATLIIIDRHPLTGGTLLTADVCKHRRVPHCVWVTSVKDYRQLHEFLDENCADGVLNVAGPRESKCPGIYGRAKALLKTVLGGKEKSQPAVAVHPSVAAILKYFHFVHLLPDQVEVSKPFCDLAHQVAMRAPQNPETTVALRKLLEAKDAAVRASIL